MLNKILIASIIFLSTITTSFSAEPCGNEWAEIVDTNKYPSWEKKIKHWESLNSKCSKTGIYEYRLSLLYTFVSNFEKAKSIIDNALKYNKYKKELLVGYFNIYVKQQKWEEAYKRAKITVQEYPNWNISHQNLGAIELIKQKYPSAIKSLEKSNSINPTFTAYRHLIVAYHQVGNHEQAIKSINTAFSLNNSIKSDREAMLAAAISYAQVKKYKVSDGLLNMLLKAKPEMKNDKEFLRIAEFVSNKLK